MEEVSWSLASRVERLERHNRRQRLALLAVPLVAFIAGAGAAQVADWKGKSVTTEKLVLMDDDGKVRGALYVHGGEPVLEF